MVARDMSLCYEARPIVGGYLTVGTWEEQREMRKARIELLCGWYTSGSDVTACEEMRKIPEGCGIHYYESKDYKMCSPTIVMSLDEILEFDRIRCIEEPFKCSGFDPDDYDDYGCP
jgi:hypothetical protein